MPSISLSAYKFKISQRNGEFYNLTSFNQNQNDILDKLDEYLLQESIAHKNDNAGKGLKSKNVIKKEVVSKEGHPYYKYVYFCMDYGDYGTESTISSFETGEVLYEQKPGDLNGKDYYVLIAMPYGGNVSNGVIIFENIGVSGIKTMIQNPLKDFASAIDEKCTFHIKPIAQTAAITHFLNNNPITKLRLIKYFASEDRTENRCSKKETIFFQPRFRNLPQIVSRMMNNNNLTNSGITEIDNFEPDDLKVVIDINGKEKTFGVSNFETLGIAEDISEHENLQLTGGRLPTEDSLLMIMKETVESYIDQVN